MAARLDAGDACAARREAERLHARTVAAVNAGRVPPRYQEELTGATAALAARIACTPPPPPVPAPADEDEAEDRREGGDRDDDKGGGRGGGKGRGKGKGK